MVKFGLILMVVLLIIGIPCYISHNNYLAVQQEKQQEINFAKKRAAWLKTHAKEMKEAQQRATAMQAKREKIIASVWNKHSVYITPRPYSLDEKEYAYEYIRRGLLKDCELSRFSMQQQLRGGSYGAFRGSGTLSGSFMVFAGDVNGESKVEGHEQSRIEQKNYFTILWSPDHNKFFYSTFPVSKLTLIRDNRYCKPVVMFVMSLRYMPPSCPIESYLPTIDRVVLKMNDREFARL